MGKISWVKTDLATPWSVCLQCCFLISLHLDKKVLLWAYIPTVSNLPTTVLIAFFFSLWNYFRGIIQLWLASEQSFSYIFSYMFSRSRTTVLKITVLGKEYLVNYLLFGCKFLLLSDTLTWALFFPVSLNWSVPWQSCLIIVVTYSKIGIKFPNHVASFASGSFYFFLARVARSVCLSVARTQRKKVK